MARTNNLTNFLNDVAAAIKEKLEDNSDILAANFDTKIREIETVGDYQSKTINIFANGSQTITPDQDYDALSSVVINVQVPIPSLQSKVYEFTENTHMVLRPETGYDGFSSVELTINVPSGTDLNVFIQKTQPNSYNGIWIQAESITQNTIIEVANENSLISGDINIVRGHTYSTILIPSNILNGATYSFDQILLVDSNGDIDYETKIYYGNSTNWIDITPSLVHYMGVTVDYANKNTHMEVKND